MSKPMDAAEWQNTMLMMARDTVVQINKHCKDRDVLPLTEGQAQVATVVLCVSIRATMLTLLNRKQMRSELAGIEEAFSEVFDRETKT